MKKYFKLMLEKFFYLLFSTKYEKIYKKIDKYSAVSFDIFDTLIKRHLKNADDVFDVIELIYNQNGHNINNFKRNRIKTQKLALSNISFEEVTLEEIYQSMNEYNIKEKKELMQLEIKIEKDICIKNTFMYNIYKKCIESKKKIFFTSDMYLPIDVIKKILEKEGYDIYDAIYLSSRERITKKSGNLFKKILNDNNLSKNKIIHIGDSPISDYISPLKNKINSILIKRSVNNCSFLSKEINNLDYNILSSFINNTELCIDNHSQYAKFGYEILGPILYGFVLWLHQEIMKDKMEKIYFLARDTKIIMDIYKTLYHDELPIYYLNISRKSIILATLGKINSLDEILNKYKSILKNTSTLLDMINVLELDLEKYKQEFTNNNIKFNKLISDLTISEKQVIFQLIIKDLEEISLLQSIYLNDYLKQNNFYGQIALVDIGWNGTIQYLLDKCNNNTLIYGYYIGVNKDKKYEEYNKIIRKGYLFDSNNLNENQIIMYLSVGIFETMFLSTEGSTLLYRNDNNFIVPVFDEQDCSEENILLIKSIQNAAKQFVMNLSNNSVNKYINSFSKNIFFENYKNFSININNKSIKMFKNIEFQNFNKQKLIFDKTLLYYLFHLKNFHTDFMNNYCKIMFMKSVFKIKFPYYKLLKKLYIWKKR